MTVDPENPVVQLCAAGMAVEGDAPAARELFAKAWALHRDDYEASIAAHYVARHQSSPEETLRWNAVAVQHAEAAADDRVNILLASLYLNLAESHRVVGNSAEAAAAGRRAREALIHLPAGEYRDFVAGAIERLHTRLPAADIAERTPNDR
jgi:hypothetical protein